MAEHNNMAVTEKSKEFFDSKIIAIKFRVGQYVWLNEHNFLG
jgi:hypothetical protein